MEVASDTTMQSFSELDNELVSFLCEVVNYFIPLVLHGSQRECEHNIAEHNFNEKKNINE